VKFGKNATEMLKSIDLYLAGGVGHCFGWITILEGAVRRVI